MLTLRRFFSLLTIAVSAVAASGCVANPTPHPGSSDNTGLSMSESAGDSALNAGATEAAAEVSEDRGADEGEGGFDNAPSAPDPSADESDTTADEGDSSVQADVGPDVEIDPCGEGPLDFDEALLSYQACESDDECTLLVDENTCECTRAVAVSDSEGAQALLDGALLCAESLDALLGPCEADVAPLGNIARCVMGLCDVESPSESCLSAPDADIAEESDDVVSDEDAGPDMETEDSELPQSD